ncbi:hypothetical protein MRX96_008774 [Rhipicephalus microplus]
MGNALDQASKLAAPVQPYAGASDAAVVPVLVPPVPQAMPLPVPVDALYVSSQMPVMTQRRILAARARRFLKLHSQMTVDDVASYITLLPGLKIDLAPALKIVAAIDWLRRQEKKSAPTPK